MENVGTLHAKSIFIAKTMSWKVGKVEAVFCAYIKGQISNWALVA